MNTCTVLHSQLRFADVKVVDDALLNLDIGCYLPSLKYGD